jgi:hypothetical protein
MRALLVMSLFVSSLVWAQQPPQRSKEDLLKEGKRISDLMKQGEQKPVLTPPGQLFKKGKATLLYALPVNKPPAYRDYLRFVSDEGLLKEAVDTVNGLAGLPRDLVVFFRDCGEPNAFYEPKTGNIHFCFELVQLFDQLYTKLATSPEQARELIRGAVFFVFFHEFGHALTHELALPITGKEEDAVDQFATLLLLEQGERGEKATLAGATFFLALSEQNPKGRLKFWDEHSLDAQRFYNIACWLFGASPFHQVNLVAKGLLPAERAARCGDEYQQLRTSWKAIADPKLKRPIK